MNQFNLSKNEKINDEKKLERLLPPPFETYNVPKLFPIIDPGFCNHPTLSSFDQTQKVYDSIEITTGEELLTPEFIEKIKQSILGFSEVQELLKDKDYIVIGSSKIDRKSDTDNPYLVSIIYNYTDNITIEVYHDINLENIMKIDKLYYQPAPTKEEIKQAIEMAKMDNFLQDKISNEMEGGALLVSSINRDDEYYNHRLLDVRFRYIHERLPLYQSLVDLSTKTVIKSGLICSCKNNHNNKELDRVG